MATDDKKTWRERAKGAIKEAPASPTSRSTKQDDFNKSIDAGKAAASANRKRWAEEAAGKKVAGAYMGGGGLPTEVKRAGAGIAGAARNDRAKTLENIAAGDKAASAEADKLLTKDRQRREGKGALMESVDRQNKIASGKADSMVDLNKAPKKGLDMAPPAVQAPAAPAAPAAPGSKPNPNGKIDTRGAATVGDTAARAWDLVSSSVEAMFTPSSETKDVWSAGVEKIHSKITGREANPEVMAAGRAGWQTIKDVGIDFSGQNLQGMPGREAIREQNRRAEGLPTGAADPAMGDKYFFQNAQGGVEFGTLSEQMAGQGQAPAPAAGGIPTAATAPNAAATAPNAAATAPQPAAAGTPTAPGQKAGQPNLPVPQGYPETTPYHVREMYQAIGNPPQYTDPRESLEQFNARKAEYAQKQAAYYQQKQAGQVAGTQGGLPTAATPAQPAMPAVPAGTTAVPAPDTSNIATGAQAPAAAPAPAQGGLPADQAAPAAAAAPATAAEGAPAATPTPYVPTADEQKAIDEKLGPKPQKLVAPSNYAQLSVEQRTAIDKQLFDNERAISSWETQRKMAAEGAGRDAQKRKDEEARKAKERTGIYVGGKEQKRKDTRTYYTESGKKVELGKDNYNTLVKRKAADEEKANLLKDSRNLNVQTLEKAAKSMEAVEKSRGAKQAKHEELLANDPQYAKKYAYAQAFNQLSESEKRTLRNANYPSASPMVKRQAEAIRANLTSQAEKAADDVMTMARDRQRGQSMTEGEKRYADALNDVAKLGQAREQMDLDIENAKTDRAKVALMAKKNEIEAKALDLKVAEFNQVAQQDVNKLDGARIDAGIAQMDKYVEDYNKDIDSHSKYRDKILELASNEDIPEDMRAEYQDQVDAINETIDKLRVEKKNALDTQARWSDAKKNIGKKPAPEKKPAEEKKPAPEKKPTAKK